MASAKDTASEITDQEVAQVYLYEFNIDHLASDKNTMDGMIQYIANGEVLFSKKFTLETNAQEFNTVELPDPLVMGMAIDKDTQVNIHVYANDSLIDQFNLKTFDAYQKTLGSELSISQNRRPPCNQDYCEPIDPCRFGLPNDCDRDGILDHVDNCEVRFNPDQADCDSDGQGNVCDNQNANYQRSGGEKTCFIDKDRHLFDFDLEHFVKQRWVDVSSCGAPDRYTDRIATQRSCSNGTSTRHCCRTKLWHSIQSFGDDPNFWCDRVNTHNTCP
ncbi:hypothetical protein [Marinicella sp. W31]|uniref:hypothetical protein n=1 Tax=Marinicella sp. W31 TaxID=3023713 RepID=UPI003756CB48